jgi:hypothetical protein
MHCFCGGEPHIPNVVSWPTTDRPTVMEDGDSTSVPYHSLCMKESRLYRTSFLINTVQTQIFIYINIHSYKHINTPPTWQNTQPTPAAAIEIRIASESMSHTKRESAGEEKVRANPRRPFSFPLSPSCRAHLLPLLLT